MMKSWHEAAVIELLLSQQLGGVFLLGSVGWIQANPLAVTLDVKPARVPSNLAKTSEWIRVESEIRNRTLSTIEVEAGESCCSKAERSKLKIAPFRSEAMVTYVKASVLMAREPFRIAVTVQSAGRRSILNKKVTPILVEAKK